MFWKGLLGDLLVLCFCLACGKLFTVLLNAGRTTYQLNWVSVSLWWFALVFLALTSMAYEGGSQNRLDARSGRYKPRTSRQTLARFARRNVAITAFIVAIGTIAQAYF